MSQEPMQCRLWNEGESAFDPVNGFERVKAYSDGMDTRKRLLRCVECGQLYFYHSYEETDWVAGNDPMYRTYIPVASEEEADACVKMDRFSVSMHTPRFVNDLRQDDTKRVGWVC